MFPMPADTAGDTVASLLPSLSEIDDRGLWFEGEFTSWRAHLARETVDRVARTTDEVVCTTDGWVRTIDGAARTVDEGGISSESYTDVVRVAFIRATARSYSSTRSAMRSATGVISLQRPTI
ncbi:hypothetical protein [Gordonia rhizosphera]|uniref:hypothetical protein n=1 Tax=Gordonia rhizosphera TaxID=83341 RepID=UPI0012F687DF|nr:hypothetical protein [Gordonia rhizosphera]